MEPRGTLFVYRRDRMISRICHMIYGWRFARKIGFKTVMLWLPTTSKYIPEDGREFDINSLLDVYELQSIKDYSDLSIVYGLNLIRSDLPSLKDVLPLDPARSAEDTRAELLSHGDKFISDHTIGYLFDNEPRSKALNDLSVLFKSLPVQKGIVDRLNELRAELGGQPYTIVHIRRGDVIRVVRDRMTNGILVETDLIQVFKRTAPLDLYVRSASQASDRSGPLIVSSDDPDVARIFRERMGSLDCRLLSDIPFSGTKMQRDFFDFLVFVGAQKIIGTQASIYGKYASIFGRNKFIDVEFKPTPEQLAAYFDEEVAGDLPVSREILEKTRATLLHLHEKMNSGQFS